MAPHHDLEDALASFKGTEAALTFSSGYNTALGIIPALLESGDMIVVDKRVHACVIDAARLSPATLRVIPHNDLDKLEQILKRARQGSSTASGHQTGRILIVTESVFSMDGDTAPLADLVALKDRYGAWLLDEAHATGMFGTRRRGLAEAVDLGDRIEIQMGTLGKAIGSAGGYICGSRPLIDFLINRARSFVFSTAPPPAPSAAAHAGIQLIQSAEGMLRCNRLHDRIRGWHALQKLREPSITPPTDNATAIVPWIVGDESTALKQMEHLLAAGIFVPAVRFPTVPRGSARLRISLNADHTPADLERLAQMLRPFP